MTLPDNLVLVGIGGAGKELVFRALEQDWILDHYLQPTIDRNRSMRVYIIDTATVEYDSDMQRSNVIRDQVRKLERTYRGAGGTISLNVACLPNIIAINRPSDLTKEEVRDAVSRNVNVWWLEDPEHCLEGYFEKLKQLDPGINQDFKQGTYRRRAMSKAVFHKAFSSGTDPLNFNVSGSEVAIVTGLGGGTGSGMFFDIARELVDGGGGANNITLFAVLPTTRERDIEKTNAYVALSELEFANLNDMSPFDHVILLPFEPTGFSGAIGKREVEEFDDVFPYILTSSYSLTGNVRAGDMMGKYAGFILADGCIIRYGMEELLEIKKRIEDTIEELNKAVECEGKFRDTLYNRLNIMRRLVGKTDAAVPAEFALYLSGRLNEVEIWNERAFDILGFDTINKVKSEIGVWKENGGRFPDDNDFRGIMDYIENMERLLQGINIKDIESINVADKKLLPNLVQVLKTIRTAGEQIEILSDMDIDVPALSKMVSGHTPSPENERALKQSISTEETEIDRLAREKNAKVDDLENLETRKDEIEEDVKDICKILEPKLDTLWMMQKQFRDLDDDIDLLDQIVTAFINRAFADDAAIGARGAGQFKGTLGFGDVVKRINKLGDLLPDQDDFDMANFLSDVATYIHSRTRCADLQDIKGGRLKKLGSWIIGGGGRDERRLKDSELTRDRTFQSLRDNADRWGIDVTAASITIPVRDIITNNVNKRIDRTIGEIVYFINKRAGDEIGNGVGPMLRGHYPTSMNLVDDTNRYLSKEFLNGENYAERKVSMEDAIADANDGIETSKNKAKFLIDLKELMEDTRATINQASGLWDMYRTKMEKMGEIDAMVGDIVNENESTYISKIEPDLAVLAGVNEDSNLRTLFDGIPVDVKETEINRIEGRATRSVNENLLSRRYLGVDNVSIEYGPERWNFRMGVLCVNTLCGDIRSQIAHDEMAMRGLVSRELSLSNIQDADIEPYDVAGRWDVGLAFFALPVFFDNLRSVEGYKSAFYSRKKGDVVNILHHSLLLNEGRIVYRKGTLEPVDAAQIAKREVDGENVAPNILENMQKIEDFACVKGDDNADQNQ